VRAERREVVLGKAGYWALGLVLGGVVLYLLREVLTPIFLSFTIAYILDPVVDRLERWRIPRGVAIAIVLFAFVAGIAGFLLLVVPEIAKDVAAVARELPDHAERWLSKAEPWLRSQGIEVPHSADEWVARLKSRASAVSASQLEPVGTALKAVIGGTVSAIGAVMGALIVPILAVYLLADFDHLVAGARALIPTRYRTSVESIVGEIDKTLAQFMRGQLTVMLILAVLYGGAYAILGVRLAIPIGIAAGVLNFVPYVGGAFALVAGLLMSLIGGGGAVQLVGVGVAYAVVQTLEGFVITPRIVGESVGLKEVWVLLALFVGGEVFGFLGVLLAVPAAAVLKIFVTRAVARYRQSALFLTPADALAAGAAVAGPTGEAPAEPELETETEAETEARTEAATETAPESIPEPEAEPTPEPSPDDPEPERD